MELRPEEVQESTEERVGRQRKTSLHVSGEEDPLVLVRFWLVFPPGQPPRTLCDQAAGDKI